MSSTDDEIYAAILSLENLMVRYNTSTSVVEAIEIESSSN